MEDINVAIIGAVGVGKSTFIKHFNQPSAPRAAYSPLTCSTPPTPSTPSSGAEAVFGVDIDGTHRTVSLFELDLECLALDPGHQMKWPKQVGGAMVPSIHGVLLMYDAASPRTTTQLAETLKCLTETGLQTVLVANNCEGPEESRQADAAALTASCNAHVASLQTTTDAESVKQCLVAALRSIIAGRQDEAAGGARARRRAAAAHVDPPAGRGASAQKKHSRHGSDLSLLRGLPGQPQGFEDVDGPTESVLSMLRSSGARVDHRHSINSSTGMDGYGAASARDPDHVPTLQQQMEANDAPKQPQGVTFDELVDRLVAPKISKADHNFADIFLCLYRKFASPSQLFSAMVARLKRTKNDSSLHYLTKTSAQLRLIEIMAKWVATYPGDFARPATRRGLDSFVRQLATDPIFAAAAHQMRRSLECGVMEDDDTGWAKTDVDKDEEAETLGDSATQANSDLAETMSSLSVDGSAERRPSESSSKHSVESSFTAKTHQFQYHSYEDYEREAATMVPTYTMPLTKFRYHIFMDTPDDDIADEMTRIDWVMFSSIRVRDLVRHLSLKPEQREQCKSMQKVHRMISHFNHIATWVANMVLMRDKAKHRAQMLEKFMHIAVKLRKMNNYSGLAAVLAGFNSSSIHRLTQTRALVSPEATIRFTKLGILMSPTKSHFAYRLAWENSPMPRIPYMPLHRRDLISAEQANPTFVGENADRINWRKFEILGEVILPIMKSQGTAYPNLTKHEVARELILDCLMPTNEDDIHERSVILEGVSTGVVDNSKKKFPWFAKQ